MTSGSRRETAVLQPEAQGKPRRVVAQPRGRWATGPGRLGRGVHTRGECPAAEVTNCHPRLSGSPRSFGTTCIVGGGSNCPTAPSLVLGRDTDAESSGNGPGSGGAGPTPPSLHLHPQGLGCAKRQRRVRYRSQEAARPVGSWCRFGRRWGRRNRVRNRSCGRSW
ncbi:uncharacterized protein WM277_023205 [Molossus nigricans]